MAMQPMRRGGGNMFGRGGPLSVASTGAKLAIGMVVATVLARLLPVAIYLVPSQAVDGLAVWQFVTWILVNTPDPLSVIFGAIILWSIGGALEGSWGTKRLLTFSLGTVFVSGLLTALLSFLVPALARAPFFGASVMTSVIWVAYGLSFGRAQMNFWGLPVTGNVLAGIGVGFVVLNALLASWVLMVPAMIGLVLTFVYVKVGTPRLLLLKLQRWKLDREMKSRNRHLRVVGSDRNGDKGSDRYIH